MKTTKAVTREMIRELVLTAIFEREELDIDWYEDMSDVLHSSTDYESCLPDRIRYITEADGSHTLQYINGYGVTYNENGLMTEEEKQRNICFSFNTRHMSYDTIVNAFVEAMYLTING